MNFNEYYRQSHGRDPFPWQVRLAAQVGSGRWPDALTLPTSSGKTAVVDVWFWALSNQVPGTPRRLYYLIDRRALVDAAADYAQALAARTLLSVSVVRLRGGLGVQDDEWLLDPSRPAFISTTVDQLGSRLLGRAYGVGRFSAALHAGLAGNDALVVIDEAHLVEPLRQTLASVGALRARGEQALSLPWHVLTMTATPLAQAETLGLGEADRAHPVLARRLAARKRAKLVTGPEGVQALVAEAHRHRDGGAAVVGVIANTVDMARAVFTSLSQTDEAMLLIGRARPPERDALAAELQARSGTGTRAGGRPALYVVATQTIEVGLDLDFDALVTELAPLSALRQRFGRLDRLGELGETHSSIVQRGEANLPYGKAALQETAKWLKEAAKNIRGVGRVVDFGLDAMEQSLAATPAPPEGNARAPLLLPDDVDLFFDPSLDLDITPYLHGERRSRDVQIAWRSALDELEAVDWGEAVEAVPPTSMEMVSLPLYAARAWLAGSVLPVGDVEGGVLPDASPAEGRPRSFVIWDGEAAQVSQNPAVLRAGMTLVVPSSAGGCDRYGWNPDSQAPVPDLFAMGQTRQRRWRGDNARTQRAVGLAEHLKGVGEKARAFALSCGLPEAMCEVLAEAGRMHDLGKNDERFQLMLGAPMGQLWAKSGQHEVRVSRLLSGLPRGWRHEVASLAARPKLPDLVRYLVGTHHGRGRPWLPAGPDVDLWREARGAEWPGLVARLRQQYGLWGLAYLEALLRLADWARSAEEQDEAVELQPEAVQEVTA